MLDHSSISPRRTSNGNGARRNSRPLMNSNNTSLPLLSLSFQTTTNPFASKQIAQTSQLVQSYPRNHLMANGIQSPSSPRASTQSSATTRSMTKRCSQSFDL